MGDHNKKRGGSFRKLFPNLFFSHKSKEKTGNKDSRNNIKDVTDSSQGNQYHNPRMIRPDNNSQGSIDNDRIYENLATQQSDNETQSYDISHHSSSSTLVSESVRNKSNNNNIISERENITFEKYTARPQVPPKPINDMQHTQTSNQINQMENNNTQYPDVYYHSLEKLTNKISPLDEIEIYRASQAQANPASVGAEIKRVSTKFLISPKKEAEIRTIQPTRARSLSFDINKENDGHRNDNTNQNIKSQSVKKSYNYSAPTSPIPVSLKIPNMPKTVSPYEHVRKAIMESEERRNSLSRKSLRNKSTPSPRLENTRSTPTPTMQDSSDKQKTRQKVEAFYWQKLKELKQKEDEYLIRQSMNSSLNSPIRSKSYGDPNGRIANNFPYIEPRSFSLPRGKDLQSYNVNQPIYTSPFVRGAPERRTDTYITNRSTKNDPEIIYRHPEKLAKIMYSRGSLPDSGYLSHTKRVSFDTQGTRDNVKSRDFKSDYQVVKKECSPLKVSELQSRVPPRPPVRTTSVGSAGKKFKLGHNKRIMHLAGSHSLCSESESGSEAGEIQRILLSNAQKGIRSHDLNSTLRTWAEHQTYAARGLCWRTNDYTPPFNLEDSTATAPS